VYRRGPDYWDGDLTSYSLNYESKENVLVCVGEIAGIDNCSVVVREYGLIPMERLVS